MSRCERQITGAGHGIGKEIAIKLAALGCIVVCWDIDEEANRLTISKIIEEGGEVRKWKNKQKYNKIMEFIMSRKLKMDSRELIGMRFSFIQ